MSYILTLHPSFLQTWTGHCSQLPKTHYSVHSCANPLTLYGKVPTFTGQLACIRRTCNLDLKTNVVKLTQVFKAVCGEAFAWHQ